MWPERPASELQRAAAARFAGLDPVGLCALRLHCDMFFNHKAVILFSQRNPIAK